MPAARYWRVVGVETYAGGDLELSELHLYGASGRLDATATLTSTIAPTAGTLAALQDDNLGTTCRFAAAAVRASGFALVWDLGAGNTADALGVRLGAATQATFMAGCTLQNSPDGAEWTRSAAFARYEWPGVGVYTLAPSVGDINFAKVSLLLHFDGANGSTTFTDSSAAPKSVTASGSAAISTAQSEFGGASLGLTGGFLSVANSADFDTATGDFTVEFWLRPTSLAASAILFTKADATVVGYPYQAYVTTSGGIVFRSYDTAAVELFSIATAGGLVAVGTGAHLAFVRFGSTFTVYVNGVASGSDTYSGSLPTNVFPMSIGAYSNGAYPLSGHIDEFRFTKGVARYTANFTPPTEPFQNSAAGGVGTVFVAPTMHTAAGAAQIAASTPVPAFSTRRAAPLQLARDVEFGGPGTIYGTTKTKGTPNTPSRARVVLLHQRSKLPVRETWSDPTTGYFEFRGIDVNQQFLTLAEDADGTFRPVAANRLTPEVLP